MFNLAPATPIQHLVDFMLNSKPDSIVISITLEENIKSARRLVTRIRENAKKIPIYIGGQAIQDSPKLKFDAKIVENFSDFNAIVKLLKMK